MGYDVRLIFALPCKNQDEKWNEGQKKLYHDLLGEADKMVYVSENIFATEEVLNDAALALNFSYVTLWVFCGILIISDKPLQQDKAHENERYEEIEMMTRENAENLYRKVNTFILSCVGADGYPLTKAVVPGKYRESLKELYFCTNTSSKFVAEISKNTKAGVYFYSRGLVWKGCLLKGDMKIVTDMSIKEKYWQDKFKNAYPQKSFTDPDFCVLKFVPSSGRFYSWYKPDDFEI